MRRTKSVSRTVSLIIALVIMAAGLTLLGFGIYHLHVIEERVAAYYAAGDVSNHWTLLLKNGWNGWYSALLIIAVFLIGTSTVWLCLLYDYKDNIMLIR